MKKFAFLLSLVFLITASSAISQSVNVTFRVDMQDQTVDPNGVFIAGSFQGWNATSNPLTEPVFGNVWETTVQVTTGETIEYKFINGSSWENVPTGCALNNNRYLTVPGSNTTLDAICFGNCLPCVLPQVDITFQVDMTNVTVSGNGVHLAGTLQGWDPATTLMTDMGNNIYAVTLSLGEGESHEYKFINGNAWGDDESVPAACATNNNRSYTVPAANETIPVVCFGSCDPCTTVIDIDVTFRVDMSEQTVDPTGVHLAGTVQGWDPSTTLMTDLGNGIWEHMITLQSGSYHEYKFVNGNAWGMDEGVTGACVQNNNRFLTVPMNDTILGDVCYASCNICTPPEFDITFTVDMSTQNISANGVHIAGSFQGWDPAATLMTNTSGNYYEITLLLGEGDNVEYKFINGDTFGDAEFVPGECNTGGNRFLTIPGISIVIDTVCFGECNACVNQLYTFNLNVNLEGPFNGATMDSDLHTSGYFWNDQPYNTEPWNYGGTETQNIGLEIDVVDWVLVEFRETDGDASTATPDKFLDHQAAILLADGSIVKPDGVNPIQLTANITENIYVVIYHRNHLAVMSSTALNGFGTVYSYNFTDALSKAYLDGQKDLTGGYFGMIGGDSDGNSTVDSHDKDANWNNNAGRIGYFGSDLNLDSEIDNVDKNDVWEGNDGSSATISMNCGFIIYDERDGQAYKTVQIGTQCWMAENLNIGTMINSSSNQTNTGTIEKYCYDNNTSNCDTYGGLYQWDEMMGYVTTEGTQGICPTGWHLPTDAEWMVLEEEVESTTGVNWNTTGWRGTDAGGNLKETGISHWYSPNSGATNSSGFTGLPGGYRYTTGSFNFLTNNAYFWSSSENGSNAWGRYLRYDNAQVRRSNSNQAYGMSVRCVMD